MSEENIINLISKYLSDNTSEDENTHLLNWIKESPSNKQYFLEMQNAWEIITLKEAIPGIDTNLEWDKMQSTLFNEKGKTISIDKSKINFPFKIAASLVLLIGLSIAVYQFVISNSMVSHFAEKNNLQTTLPEGSKFYLLQGSKLEYKSGSYNKNNREVKLTGQGYFIVKKDPLKPFIVSTQDYHIEVLGTEFLVDAQSTDSLIVLVSSGRVAVYSKSNPTEKYFLNKGQQGVFKPKNSKTYTYSEEDENILAWKTKKLVFKNKKLKTVIKQISKLYKTDVRIDSKSIENCKITVTFDHQELHEVIAILEMTLNIKAHTSAGKIVLKGTGC